MCTSGLVMFPSYELSLFVAVVVNVACLLWYREADPFYSHATNDLQFVCNLFGKIWAHLPYDDRQWRQSFTPGLPILTSPFSLLAYTTTPPFVFPSTDITSLQ